MSSSPSLTNQRMSTKKHKVGFFVRTKDPSVLNHNTFYSVDIQILLDLGFDVIHITSIKKLFLTEVDSYYCWWPGYSLFAILWAKLNSRKSILTGALHTQDCQSMLSWPLYKFIPMLASIYLSDYFIYMSHADKAKMIGFRKKSSSIIYQSVSKFYSNLQGSSSRSHPTPGNVTICTVSALTLEHFERKRLRDCLLTIKHCLLLGCKPNYILIGRMAEATSLIKSLIIDMGLSDYVKLAGIVDDETKLSIFQHSHFYLQPSFCEGFGLAIVEARFCSIPVITSHEQCISEINEDFVKYANNPAEMASFISQLCHDPDEYTYQSSRSQLNLDRYTYAHRLASIRGVYDKINL